MQLMILLSALLASLTGLMAGGRPVEPAQVALSAPRIAVQAPAAVAAQVERPANSAPWLRRLPPNLERASTSTRGGPVQR